VGADCPGDDPPEDAPQFGDDASLDYVTTPSGLMTFDRVIGEGAAVHGDSTVLVHYSGFLEDGCSFDFTFGGEPRSFPLSAVLPGFAEGLEGMRVGGERRLRVPPDLGYGGRDLGSIPPGSTLVFEVVLVAIDP
jgi:FKBP-type peptidyl-prolyl cis-trans isomerase